MFRIPMRGYEIRAAAVMAMASRFRIPMRGYEAVRKRGAVRVGAFRIPMRGYETTYVLDGETLIVSSESP